MRGFFCEDFFARIFWGPAINELWVGTWLEGHVAVRVASLGDFCDLTKVYEDFFTKIFFASFFCEDFFARFFARFYGTPPSMSCAQTGRPDSERSRGRLCCLPRRLLSQGAHPPTQEQSDF